MTALAAPTSVGEALQSAAALGLDRLDAQMLLLHVLARAVGDRAWLLTHDNDKLPPEVLARFHALCERRSTGEPVAYLTGRKEFHGLDLAVDARVLVPRPDTETLVDWALEVLQGMTAPRVLDLGTGSGAIALAIRHARPDARVMAADASPDALAVAEANAERLGLDVTFRHGNWLQGLDGPFELIVSNPPYVADNDSHLPALAHEPLAALTSGPDGLNDLRRLCADAPSRLTPGGWLLLEHGWDQAHAVRHLLATHGLQAPVSRKDLSGIERCSGAHRPSRG